jgi:3-methyladenine DNA glycosylase/8-oxoguanine DNA glycosylase
MERLAKPWREHASVASWYLWRVADEAKIKVIKKGSNKK